MPIGLAISVLTVIGLGSFLASVNVRFRDVRYIIPFFIQIFLFLTPVIYPISVVPGKWQWLLSLNPLSGVITAVRASFLRTSPVSWGALGESAFIATSVCHWNFSFRKTEPVTDVAWDMDAVRISICQKISTRPTSQLRHPARQYFRRVKHLLVIALMKCRILG